MSKEKLKILIIEDDPFLLSMYSTKFELENYNVVVAEDGEKGLNFVEKEMPDVILLDLMLPKINGFDVLRGIKSNDRTRNIPVILLTNLNQKDEIDRGMDLGAVDYLIKAHFMPSEVVDKIKGIIKDRAVS